MVLTIALGIILAAIGLALLPAIISLVIGFVALVCLGVCDGISYLLWIISLGKYNHKL